MTKGNWTDQDYEQMSWHDNHVHALSIVEGEHGSGELILDIDYIMEWHNCKDGYEFKIVPAALVFKQVTDLVISLDYKSPSAGMCPFSISSIEREYVERERYMAQHWKIEINWPVGSIEFEAQGYEQISTGTPVLSKSQCLDPSQRESHA